jgi:hypothetical protein
MRHGLPRRADRSRRSPVPPQAATRRRRAFTCHEAADVRRFRPLPVAPDEKEGALVFVGSWGDEERTMELRDFIVGPVRDLGRAASAHGVR